MNTGRALLLKGDSLSSVRRQMYPSDSGEGTMAPAAKRRPPLGDAVRDDLRRLILDGSFPAGSRLPSEPDLCDQYNVSRITLREAVQGLVQEGYLIRRQGSGTYVTRRPSLRNSLDQNFSYTEYLERAGIRAGKKILSARAIEADAATAAALSIDPGVRVVEIRRLRTADRVPAVYSVDAIPADIVSLSGDRRALQGSLYRLLAERGHAVDHGEAVVAPAVAEGEVAELLEVAPGALLQHLEQVDYDAAERPVMYSLEWHVPSVFEVRVYRRGPGPLAAEYD